MHDIRNYAVTFTLNLGASGVLYVITRRWEFVLLFFLFAGGIIFAVLWRLSFRRVGLFEWSYNKGMSRAFRRSLDTCSSSLDFLVSWGDSLRSLSPYVEKTLKDLTNIEDCSFRFLLVRPDSLGEVERRKSHGTWPPDQPATNIRWLLRIKEALGDKANKFRIALYDDIPVWAIAIVDNKRAIVGFYGKGPGRDNPGLVAGRLRDKPSFFEAFMLEYERVWSGAKEMKSAAEFETLITESKGSGK